jgi:hypothetical protein
MSLILLPGRHDADGAQRNRRSAAGICLRFREHGVDRGVDLSGRPSPQ